MCRGSEKYFVLILYRLFSAESKKRLEGNVNLIIVDGYIMKGGYCRVPSFSTFPVGVC